MTKKKLLVAIIVGILVTSSLFAFGNKNTATSTSSSFNRGTTYVMNDKNSDLPTISMTFLEDGHVLFSKKPYDALIVSEYYLIGNSIYLEEYYARLFFKYNDYAGDYILAGTISNDEKSISLECGIYKTTLTRQ